MKKGFIVIILFLSISVWMQGAVLAQTPTFQWAQSMGSNDIDGSYAVATDALGNIINTGTFRGTVDFDPGSGQFNLQSMNGSADIFVTKVDPNGNFLWAVSLSGSSNNFPEAIATDAAGNVYITAAFLNTIDVDPGSGTTQFTSSGSFDVLLVKLDPNGNLLWGKQVGGSSTERARGLGIDVNGNVTFAGYFSGTADLDPGTGVQNHTSAGSSDAFVLKLTPAGDLLWADSFGGTENDRTMNLTHDPTTGAVYICGHFNGTADQDPGSGTFNITSQGSSDIFVTKLDTAGNFVWSKTMGGPSHDYGGRIATDHLGNVFVAARFASTADLDPGTGVDNHTSNGFSDACIIKLDASGNFGWANSFGSIAYDYFYGIATDDSSSVYLTGAFKYSIDVDPDTSVHQLTSNGDYDVMAIKYDLNGALQWGFSVGSSGFDQGWGLALDPTGGLILSGFFNQSFDFDPGAGVQNLSSSGSSDAFLTKLGGCSPSFSTDSVTSCGSYTWIDGITYTTSNNTAIQMFTNQNGCDSVVSLDLTVYQPQASTETVTACGTYTWIDGITYTASTDSATTTFTGQNGCDSVVTLDLTLNQPVFTTTSVSACEPYTWTDGITYTSDTDSAQQVLVSANGCDSVITLDLTVITLDSGLTASDTNIVANDTTATYQWLDCTNDYQPIPGANTRDFEPQEGGTYAVEITKDGCVDTTACVFVSSVGIARIQQSAIKVFPNPNNGRFAIEFGDEKINRITIFNVAGQVVWNQNVQYEQVQWIELNVPAGLYFLNIESNTGLTERKTIVISPH